MVVFLLRGRHEDTTACGNVRGHHCCVCFGDGGGGGREQEETGEARALPGRPDEAAA